MTNNAKIKKAMNNPDSDLNKKRDQTGGCRCAACGSGANVTIDSRPQAMGIRRRRRCVDCQHRWTTIEIDVSSVAPGADLPRVQEIVKRDKVLECLNALAAVTATLIAGTEDYEALEFFVEAMNQNITDISRRHADPQTNVQG